MRLFRITSATLAAYERTNFSQLMTSGFGIPITRIVLMIPQSTGVGKIFSAILTSVLSFWILFVHFSQFWNTNYQTKNKTIHQIKTHFNTRLTKHSIARSMKNSLQWFFFRNIYIQIDVNRDFDLQLKSTQTRGSLLPVYQNSKRKEKKKQTYVLCNEEPGIGKTYPTASQ